MTERWTTDRQAIAWRIQTAFPGVPALSPSFHVVCVSHLIWEETLFQRPQQLMKRLRARGHAVNYLSLVGSRAWRAKRRAGATSPRSGITPEGLRYGTLFYTPLSGRFRSLERINDARLMHAASQLPLARIDSPTVLWLYHPERIGLVDLIPHDLLVYDVMDHFPAFRSSRSDIETTEDKLLRLADVVFTGGRSMHEKKAPTRPDAVCFPSGVDVAHFARAMDAATPIPEEIADLPRPILGYFGAVDERIDYELVEAICRARPDWSYVFIGPLVGMDRAPVDAPNFHHLGARPYARLPEYLKAFDVATMPWVRSELTAHISPTKTPEYLAGGAPVVSVPVPDVERDYGDVVSFASTPEDFVAACEKLLNTPLSDLAQSLSGRAASASWDTIAEEMEAIVQEKWRERRDRPSTDPNGG
jgi:UDP-galactopyranose mutase